MMLRFVLIPVLGDKREFLERGPARRDGMHAWLNKNLGGFFDEDFEHVTVLFEGERRDMFVGETSAINGRHIRNVRATEIYRANAIQAAELGIEFNLPPFPVPRIGRPIDPETLPAISGPAVLFPDTVVWT